MRVLMVSDVYLPRVNGVSTSIATFRRALADEDIEVEVIAPDYGGEAPADPGVYRVRSRPVPRDPEDRIMHWSSLREQIEARAPEHDLIHIQTPFLAHYAALRAARSLDLPVIATYHTLFEAYFHHYIPFIPAAWLARAARRLSRSQCNDLDAVIVPSSALQARLREYGVSRPLHVLPTGIALDEFESGDGVSFRRSHGLDAQAPLLLFVGRVAAEKNIDFLIRCMPSILREHPDTVLLITGEGPGMPALLDQVERLGLGASVRFIGYLDRTTTLRDCYAAADLFVFASRTETQGLVLIEAMASGVPVVALSVMGTRDILEPAQGAWIAPDQEAGFAQGVCNLLGDRLRREAMALAARRDAMQWSDRAMAARMAKLYRSFYRPRLAWPKPAQRS